MYMYGNTKMFTRHQRVNKREPYWFRVGTWYSKSFGLRQNPYVKHVLILLIFYDKY